MLLDEPTSALDETTEARVLDAMENLMEGRTVFIATHRIPVLRYCDTVLLLEGGSVQKAPDIGFLAAKPRSMLSARAAASI
jgi:ABC-type bacteriocin/lantibiotic exporter with double-glycine peptidase domain